MASDVFMKGNIVHILLNTFPLKFLLRVAISAIMDEWHVLQIVSFLKKWKWRFLKASGEQLL